MLRKEFGAPRHHELFPGAGHRHVEFAVDKHSVLLKAIGGEEVELVTMGDGERIDDDIALRTLIALHGVN